MTVKFDGHAASFSDHFFCSNKSPSFFSRLNSRDILYPGNLYKGIFWMNNTKVMYIGAQHQWFTMPQFEIQGFYARDVITGKIPLPDQAAMEADSKKWMEREDNLPDELSGIQFQGDIGRGG